MINNILFSIGKPPTASQGLHKWIRRAAIACRSFPPEIVADRIFNAVQGCGRQDIDEIKRAVSWSRGLKSGQPREGWPKRNNRLIGEVTGEGLDIESLRRRSPVDPDSFSAEQVIDRLFPQRDVLLCMGGALETARTHPKSAFRGVMSEQQFVVPNRMTKVFGEAKAGHRSRRCLDNTGPRDYLVIEFDPRKWDGLSDSERQRFGSEGNYRRAKKRDSAAVLWHLAGVATRTPLVMVVDSANRSLHGWFSVKAAPERTTLRLFLYAVALGADSATWNRCQLVRMPQGL